MYELTISLQPKSGTPLYEQIYDHIKGEIQDGHIKSGEKLPSTQCSLPASRGEQEHSRAGI